MSKESQIETSKWTSLLIFLILDFIQISIVSILALDETQPQMVSLDLSRNNPLVSVSLFTGICLAQLFLIYYFTFDMLRKPDMIQLYPKFDEKQIWKCHYSRDDIVKLTNDLANQSEVSLKSIYLMHSPLPNAFTFSLPLIGSVVVLHSNLLDFLDLDEVRSVIAHELGHIKHRDSLVSIFTRLPSFFVDLIYLYVYIRVFLGAATSLVVGDLGQALIRAIILLSFFALSRLMVFISRYFLQKASRNAELLSDIYAARVTSPSIMINALIRLGQRVEAMSVLISEIKWLESLNPERVGTISTSELTRIMSSYPLDDIDENNAKSYAPDLYLTTKLAMLRDVYGVGLTDQQIADSVAPAVEELRKKRKLETPVDKSKKGKVVDWRAADYDGDRRLSDEELIDFIKLLRDNPNKLMFDSEVGMNVMLMDHPDFRRRVILLAEIFKL